MIYNIEKLAEKAGVTRRTVRYYVQRRLLDPPEGEKRGSYYTEKHLERLRSIQKLAEQGVPLIHMKKILDGDYVHQEESDDPAVIHDRAIETYLIGRRNGAGTTCADWKRIEISDGVELHFQPDKISLSKLYKIRDYINNIIQGGKIDD